MACETAGMANDLTGDTVELLQTLIRNECVNDGTAESGHESRNADVLQSYVEGDGVDIERWEPTPDRASFVARLPGTDPTAPSLCLMGHTDVVPVTPEGWREDPFGGEIIANEHGHDEVWGRGAIDMLNLTSSMAVVFRSLVRRGFRPKGDLLYFAVADEEAGSAHGARWVADNHPDSIRCDYMLTENGGLHVGSEDQQVVSVNVAEKGVAWRRLRVRGTPGHGSMPFGSDNALVTAAKVVSRLAEYSPAPRFHELWRGQVESLGLPDDMKMGLVEPLRELFKDEVRKIGLELGLPYDMLYRHPFPGPGLGVRVLGEIKKEYCDLLRKADAIFIEELQNVLVENNLPAEICQLGADTSEFPIAKELIADPNITLIDYTGNTIFGNWIETQQIMGKTVFTEKAGVNSVIIESTDKYKEMLDNLAFSVCLYSGQMCTAPQNFFIPADGIETENGSISFDEVVEALASSINGLVDNPKMGAGVLGCIQNDATISRVLEMAGKNAKIVVHSKAVKNTEFENARTASPIVLQIEADSKELFTKELFGPIVLFIKTKDTNQSIALAKKMASEHGAISCAAYSSNSETIAKIGYEMASSFTPVSFNLTGGIFVNQNAAFSDFHVSGGNPSGNASFTDPNYVNRRFVWVGHRYA